MRTWQVGPLRRMGFILALAWLAAGCRSAGPAATLVPPPSVSPTLARTRAPSATATPAAVASTPTNEATASQAAVASPTPASARATRQPTSSPKSARSAATAASATATVTTVPVTITRFTAAPSEIQPGAPVTLTWQAKAQRVTLWRLDPLGRLAEAFEVPISGTLVVGTPAGQRERVDFMLFATTGAVTAQASAFARILCPDTWYFANPPDICPLTAPHYTAMQAQSFERGLMLWTQVEGRIYILYGDTGSPRWDVQPDAWTPGQPETDPSLVPPPGLYQPVRGFGVAWRTVNAGPGQVVGDRLGWATGEEFGLADGAVQCDSAPKYNHCYIRGPAGVVYDLQPERSGWAIWGVP